MSERESKPAGKWWEQYYVRYFVGTFVGVAVIFGLADRGILASEISRVVPPFAEIKPTELTAVALMGLAYCYIASAPVLTLHAVRGSWSRFSDRGMPWIWIGSTYVVAALALTTAATIGRSYPADICSLAWIGAVVLVLVCGGQGILLGFAIYKLRAIEAFYRNLSDQRREELKNKRDYVESYRHLREHGNAKLIVVFEILLGVVLGTAVTMTQFICFLILWILPATFSWFIASALEADLAMRDVETS